MSKIQSGPPVRLDWTQLSSSQPIKPPAGLAAFGLGHLAALLTFTSLAGALLGSLLGGFAVVVLLGLVPPTMLPTESVPAAVEVIPGPLEGNAITAAERAGPAVVTIIAREAETLASVLVPSADVGSGVIFDEAGWILTNSHVVGDARELSVELADGRRFEGQVYGTDTLTDLAVVKVEEVGLPVSMIGDSDSLRPGQQVIAIGSPLGAFSNSVTVGVVSALGRTLPVAARDGADSRLLRQLIQTDAAINPGNSGGALLDGAGQLIGINTAVAGSAQNIGFAIPISYAKPLLRQALAGERLRRPWIGISGHELDPAAARSSGLPASERGGVLIVGSRDGSERPSVWPDSPAERAGLREGDVIFRVGDVAVGRSLPIDVALLGYGPGEEAELGLWRAGEQIEIIVELGERPSGL